MHCDANEHSVSRMLCVCPLKTDPCWRAVAESAQAAKSAAGCMNCWHACQVRHGSQSTLDYTLGFATRTGCGGQARAHGRAAAAAAAAGARPRRHRRRGAGAGARGGRGGDGGGAGGAGLRGGPASRGACCGVRWGGLGGLRQGRRRRRRVLLGAGGAGRGGAGQRRARGGGRAADVRDLALQVRARPRGLQHALQPTLCATVSRAAKSLPRRSFMYRSRA
jgi:hypothetical protein